MPPRHLSDMSESDDPGPPSDVSVDQEMVVAIPTNEFLSGNLVHLLSLLDPRGPSMLHGMGTVAMVPCVLLSLLGLTYGRIFDFGFWGSDGASSRKGIRIGLPE